MICHETYKSAEGKWLLPTDVVFEECGTFKDQAGVDVTRGRSEKMSKSKRNVVDPEEIIETYGADTARLFMLSDSPPDRDLDWTDSGVDGAWRYVNRLWRLVDEPAFDIAALGADRPEQIGGLSADVERMVHRSIVAVTEALDRFHFNKAVARIRELSNAVETMKPNDSGAAWVLRFATETLTILIGPLMPHLAEEMWQTLGHKTLIAHTLWPVASQEMLIDDKVTIAVQVNGKLRGTLNIAKDSDKETIEQAALMLEGVQTFIEGKVVRKIIVVPNKIVNVVI